MTTTPEWAETLRAHYLGLSPLGSFEWPPHWDPPRGSLDWADQATLMAAVLEHPAARAAPPPIRAQRAFVGALVRRIEAAGDGYHDALIAHWLGVLAADKARRGAARGGARALALPRGLPLAVWVAEALIGPGALTGLSLWDGALFLAEHLLAAGLPAGTRRVLELGSGTGLVGLVASRAPGGNLCHVTLTDADATVLDQLRDTVARNRASGALPASATVDVRKLDWDDWAGPDRGACLDRGAEPERGESRVDSSASADQASAAGGAVSTISSNGQNPFAADLILGADVAYDPTLHEALAGTLKALLSLSPGSQALIQLTLRRQDTHDHWVACMARHGLHTRNLSSNMPLTPRPGWWITPGSVGILFQLSLP